MPAVAILGSMGSGHGSFPPRPSIQGDSSFMINNKPVMVTGDAFAVHSDGHSSHGGTVIGASHITVNGKKVAMVGDKISCGSTVATGDNSFQIS